MQRKGFVALLSFKKAMTKERNKMKAIRQVLDKKIRVRIFTEVRKVVPKVKKLRNL